MQEGIRKSLFSLFLFHETKKNKKTYYPKRNDSWGVSFRIYTSLLFLHWSSSPSSSSSTTIPHTSSHHSLLTTKQFSFLYFSFIAQQTILQRHYILSFLPLVYRLHTKGIIAFWCCTIYKIMYILCDTSEEKRVQVTSKRWKFFSLLLIVSERVNTKDYTYQFLFLL